MSVILNNFPKKTRGTYRIKSDEDTSESKKLEFAKDLILDMAKTANITILLDCKLSGTGWLLIWWPASELRHQETDEIIN